MKEIGHTIFFRYRFGRRSASFRSMARQLVSIQFKPDSRWKLRDLIIFILLSERNQLVCDCQIDLYIAFFSSFYWTLLMYSIAPFWHHLVRDSSKYFSQIITFRINPVDPAFYHFHLFLIWSRSTLVIHMHACTRCVWNMLLVYVRMHILINLFWVSTSTIHTTWWSIEFSSKINQKFVGIERRHYHRCWPNNR